PIDLAALARGTCRGPAVDQLPGDDAMEDVSARLDGENLVVELDVAALAGVEGLYLDLHLSFPCSRRPSHCLPTWAPPPGLHSRPRPRLPLPPQRQLPARRRSPRLPRRSAAPESRGPPHRRPGQRPAVPIRRSSPSYRSDLPGTAPSHDAAT